MCLQLTLPWRSFFFLHFLLTPAGGISWLFAPGEHKNVRQGLPFKLLWHYKMDENETFLSSRIYLVENPNTSLASKHEGEDRHYKHQSKDSSFSISGKNNVTFTVHRAEIGQNLTYCCEVIWRLVAEKRNDRRCSEIFVYDVPQITYHIPQLFCKQGDSIKLQCNATGIPKPHVDWIHDDTKELIDSSSDIELNITGKRSEGRYCCDANNGFGKKTACTAVDVTEYEPENTTLVLVKETNRDDVIIHIECKADASPPSNRFMITLNDTQYNSSDGLKTIEVQAPRNDKRHEVVVSCIPCNKYGQGPIKKVVLSLYVPPRFIAPIRKQYNMTVSGITLKCNVTGIPTPHITWTSGDTGDIVGTGKYYKVLYVKYAKKRLTFHCHARNAIGNITSPEIYVNAPPRFIGPIPKQYNMTVSGITLKCDVTGIPTPHIKWTSGDTGDIVGTGKYYKVPYVKCATKMLTFYCHARNAIGNISSPEIYVNVMTARNCSTADKGLDETKWFVIVCVVVGFVIVVPIALITWRRRNIEAQKDAETTTPMSEDPYQDPTDAVSNGISTNEGYATVEECGLRPRSEFRIPMMPVETKPITVETKPSPEEEDLL